MLIPEVTASQKTRVFLEAHGCSASFADAEILSGLISDGGYEVVESEEDADLSVLVTCSVKSITEQRMLSRIRDLSSGGKNLIVAGCLAKSEPAQVLKIVQGVSMIGPGNLDQIVPAIDATLAGRQLVSTQNSHLIKLGMPRTRKNSAVGIIEIASGCLSGCTFCQVKLVKGTVFSYPEDEIVAESKRLVGQGVREIWLTSTDNAAYGRDSHTSLAELIDKVCDLQGDFMVRVGMMNPLLTSRILDDMLRAFQNEKVFKFLHLPVQSGNERILGMMQRGYTVDAYHETVAAFRAVIPSLTLSTDIIVGFPSETESEFCDSMDLLRKSRPDVVNISRFGAREGTKAALMDRQVSTSEAKNRSARMTALTKQISKENNQSWLGWAGKILLDEVGKNAVIGRNFAYKPCLLKENSTLDADDARKIIGRDISVRVFDATSSTLRVIKQQDDTKPAGSGQPS